MDLQQTAREGSFRLISRSLAILLAAILGCSQQVEQTQEPDLQVEKSDVYVVSYPLAFFAERIGGGLVEVTFPVPPDLDPATWEPDEDDVARFQSADLVLLNGADYAKWTLRTSLPWSRTVVTTRDIEEQYIDVPNAVTHTHGPEGEHSHAGLASETWIDPGLAVAQARVIKEELQKLLPDSTDVIEANFDALRNDLISLHEAFNVVFARSTLRWTASYPAFRYLGRRYDLALQTMNWDPSELPSDEQWAEFDKLLEGNDRSFMLWTDEPNPKTLDRLEKRGVRIVVFRLALHGDKSNDYFDIMRQNLDELEAAIAAQPQE